MFEQIHKLRLQIICLRYGLLFEISSLKSYARKNVSSFFEQPLTETSCRQDIIRQDIRQSDTKRCLNFDLKSENLLNQQVDIGRLMWFSLATRPDG